MMPKSEMLQYGESWIDPAEKDNFVSGLMSGKSTHNKEAVTGPFPYQSPLLISKLAKWSIIGTAVYTFLYTLADSVAYYFYEQFDEQQYLIWTTASNIGLKVDWFLLLPPVVFYCIWILRCAKNCHALTDSSLINTPKMSVIWYFLPITSFWKPLPDMKQFWKLTLGFRQETSPSVAIINWWWALWVGGDLITTVVNLINQSDEEPFTTLGLVINMLSTIPQLIAAILIYQIITKISTRQVEIFA